MAERDTEEAVRARFAATAPRLAAHTRERVAVLEERVRRLLPLRGDERALDAGTGAGALALALAPHVREVVAVDLVPELLAAARELAAELDNVSFVEGDVTALPFASGSFDVAGCVRTLHHVRRPELAIAELARVTRPGGSILVVDQIAPVDPLAALELDRFERARDPSHTRTLSDPDMRGFFDANGLLLRRAQLELEERELEPYLDLAGCEGDERDRARGLRAGDTASVTMGWYVLAKQRPR